MKHHNGTLLKYRANDQAKAMPTQQHQKHRQSPTSTEPAHQKPFATVYTYSSNQSYPAHADYSHRLNPEVAGSVELQTKAAQPSIVERLIISQCKTCLVPSDIDALTHDSSLSTWMAAWDRAGILDSVMTATLADIALAKLIISSHRLRLEDIELSDWPIWGLKVIADEQRQHLNSHAMHRTSPGVLPGCHKSMLICFRQGIEASLGVWLRAWKGTSIINPFVASVSGVGHCQRPVFSSQCELGTLPLSDTFEVSVLATGVRRTGNPCYVQSGQLRTNQGSAFYAYQPRDRVQIPKVDAFSWLTSNRLAVTQQLYGSHPFSLIERYMGEELNTAEGFHSMGLLVRPEAHLSDNSYPDALDVVITCDESDATAEGKVIRAASLPERQRMPGVFPNTWIIDCAGSRKAGRSVPGRESLHLCRGSDVFESIINNWLLRVASECGLPNHTAQDSLRTAKCSDVEGMKFLLHPATDFALRIGNDDISKAYSKFRLPIGSLIGAGLALKGINHDEAHPICGRQAIETLIELIGWCIDQPRLDLNALLRWLIFDSLVGVIEQSAYRYQIISLDTTLALAAIPFWSLESDTKFCENTRRDFGYQVLVCRSEARRIFDGENLKGLAIKAGHSPEAIQGFRTKCLGSLKRSAPTIRARLKNEAIKLGALQSPSFRSAKSMLDWISENEQPHGVNV